MSEKQTEKTEAKERIAKALEEVTAVLEKYQVTFLPRIDYKNNGEPHNIVVALFDVKPLEEEKKND